MKNKVKKFHKTAKDYKARRLGFISGIMASICLGVFIPLANEIKSENLMLSQQIEVLNNGDYELDEIMEENRVGDIQYEEENNL